MPPFHHFFKGDQRYDSPIKHLSTNFDRTFWDYQLNLSLIWNEITTKPFIIFGAIALVIFLILAGTSFKSLQRKMGKTWVWLHRLAYVAGVLVAVHYLLSIKGDLFSFQGDFALPTIGLVIVILLLKVRIPTFYHFLRHWFVKE